HYFQTLGIPLLEGRDLTFEDRQTSAPIAIVSRKFARMFFPGQDALGTAHGLIIPVGSAIPSRPATRLLDRFPRLVWPGDSKPEQQISPRPAVQSRMYPSRHLALRKACPKSAGTEQRPR